MMIKIVSLFLIAMVALGLFGKLRFPGQRTLSNMKCSQCGRYRIGKGPCHCGKGKG